MNQFVPMRLCAACQRGRVIARRAMYCVAAPDGRPLYFTASFRAREAKSAAARIMRSPWAQLKLDGFKVKHCWLGFDIEPGEHAPAPNDPEPGR